MLIQIKTSDLVKLSTVNMVNLQNQVININPHQWWIITEWEGHQMSHIPRLVLQSISIQKISSHQSIPSLLVHLSNQAIILVFHKVLRNKYLQINKYMWGDNQISLASLSKRNKLIMRSMWVIISPTMTCIISTKKILESTINQQEAGQASNTTCQLDRKVVLMNVRDLNKHLTFLHNKTLTQEALEVMILMKMSNYKKLS